MGTVLGRLLLGFLALTFQTACTRSTQSPQIFKIGDKAQAGALIYNVVEADWRAQLGEGPQGRTPSRRFLIVRLNVTNGGAQILSVPPLQLVDDTGHVYSESIDGQDVPSWLGLIRTLKPAGTLDGNVLFDVEPKSYKLKVEEGAGSGRAALVEMPLRFGLEQSITPVANGTPDR